MGGDALSQIGDFFRKIGTAFDAIRGVQQGMQDIFEGLATEMAAGPIGFSYAVKDLFQLTEYIFVFIFTHLECMNKISKNYVTCFLTYTVDFMIGLVLLIPCTALYLTCFLAGWDYNEQTGKIKRMTEEVDEHIFGIFGIHIIHWPKPIRDMCYNCKRLRPEALVAKTMDVEYDMTGRIATLAVGGVMKMFGGVGKITDALKL
jgi:hypothetical protein